MLYGKVQQHIRRDKSFYQELLSGKGLLKTDAAGMQCSAF